MRPSQFKEILKPIKFGRMVSFNRLYFSSVGFDVCDENGRPLPEFYEIYQSIMDGGCGFGFLGNASVDPQSQYTARSQKLISESHAQDLLPTFEAARERNVLLLAQLQHYGSGEASFLSTQQIEEYITHFVKAAKLASDNQFPGLQIHAANGYLLSSFLSPRSNKRTDEWGGTPIKRARILLEILRRIRASVREDMLLFVRLQIDDGFGKEGLQFDQLSEVVCAIEEAGADAITCATGVAETFSRFLGDAEFSLDVSRRAGRFLKERTRLPIGFAGNINNLQLAEDILLAEEADFIGFGRQIVADHNFVKKELSGHSSYVHRCLWDSYCLRDKKEPEAKRVYCCVNPKYRRPQHIQLKYKES